MLPSKRRIVRLGETLKEYSAASREQGGFVSPAVAAISCGVSRTRIYEKIEAGHFQIFVFRSVVYLSVKEVAAYMRDATRRKEAA